MANQGLRPFVAIPKDLREWTRWCRDQVLSADDDTVATETIQDEAVTYAKIQDVAADRILGRLTSAGVVTELTAADLVTLLEAEGWAFAGTLTFPGNIQSNITDANVSHALNPVFSDTEVEAALDALGAKINAVLTALDGFGVTA